MQYLLARPEVRGTADTMAEPNSPPVNPPRTHSRLYHALGQVYKYIYNIRSAHSSTHFLVFFSFLAVYLFFRKNVPFVLLPYATSVRPSVSIISFRGNFDI